MHHNYQTMAKKALEDLYARFWTEDDGGHILPTHCGVVVEKPLMIWEVTMLLIAMETYYDATGDEETKRRILGTWKYLKTVFPYEKLTACFGEEPNLALDDTGWDIMAYLMFYRLTGDPELAEMIQRTLLGAYEHYSDGPLENGLWYCDWKQYNDHWKSSYIVSLLISAWEFCKMTEGTPLYSQELYDKTMILYRWTETYFRRDRTYTVPQGLADGGDLVVDTVDYLYWVDYNQDREGRPERNGPSGGTTPNRIGELGSVCGIFIAMGMAALNVKLYQTVKDPRYLQKALETSSAVATINNVNGAYMNDRDIHTNATMLRYFVHEILATDYATDSQRDMLFRTADNIYASGVNCHGIYYPWWGKICTPDNVDHPQLDYFRNCLMINATSVTMICGAALLESLGYQPTYGKPECPARPANQEGA